MVLWVGVGWGMAGRGSEVEEGGAVKFESGI